MRFWHTGLVNDLLCLAVFLGIAIFLRSRLPILRQLAVPTCIIAGFAGFLLGPSVLGWAPFSATTLEEFIYHALALVFISVSLQSPDVGRQSAADVRSMAFAVPIVTVIQGISGLLFVLLAAALGTHLHPGFGLMLPLAFSQGPGQALSLGAAWENGGMENGAQIGLIMAAIGFSVCAFFGIFLVAWARKKGWVEPIDIRSSDDESAAEGSESSTSPGSLAPFSMHVVLVLIIYALTYGALMGASQWLENRPQLMAMLFGFHFIIGSGIAILVRVALTKMNRYSQIKREPLSQIAMLLVDFATTAALCAVTLRIFQKWFLPLLLLGTLGTLLTLFLTLWIAKRAFRNAPFSHSLVLFGAMTGTTPTGLALLRMVDPQLKGPVARTMVLAATGAIALGAPLLLVVIPLATTNWPATFPGHVLWSLALCTGYLILLVVFWRLVGGFRFRRPLWKLWPEDD